MSSIYDWSLEADKNGTADIDIIWEEEQQPHVVNNSARMMMSRIREYIADTGLVKSDIKYPIILGTREEAELYETDYHDWFVRQLIDWEILDLYPRSDVKGFTDGMVYKFRANGDTYGYVMLRIKKKSVAGIYKQTANGLRTLQKGDIRRGNIYTVVYNDKKWILLNPTIHQVKLKYDVYKLPAGMIHTFASEKVPDGWLPCDGSIHKIDDYPNLYAVIGDRSWIFDDPNFERAPAGYFHVPDFRGCFLSGAMWEDGHWFGWTHLDDFKEHTHTGTASGGSYYLQRGNSVVFPDPLKWLHLKPDDIEELQEEEGHDHKIRYTRIGSIEDVEPNEDEEFETTSVMNLIGDRETVPINMTVTYGIKT